MPTLTYLAIHKYFLIHEIRAILLKYGTNNGIITNNHKIDDFMFDKIVCDDYFVCLRVHTWVSVCVSMWCIAYMCCCMCQCVCMHNCVASGCFEYKQSLLFELFFITKSNIVRYQVTHYICLQCNFSYITSYIKVTHYITLLL